MSAFANILAGGVFHAAVLFLVAAGLQLVFGVQKIVNLACGSFYALGAYFGITFIGYASQFGMSPWLILPGLIVSGVLRGSSARDRAGPCGRYIPVTRASSCC